MPYPCKLTAPQRAELIAAAGNGKLADVAQRFGISLTRAFILIREAKDAKQHAVPTAMLDLYVVLKRKVGGKAAREMVYDHMQQRGMVHPASADQLRLGSSRHR